MRRNLEDQIQFAVCSVCESKLSFENIFAPFNEQGLINHMSNELYIDTIYVARFLIHY